MTRVIPALIAVTLAAAMVFGGGVSTNEPTSCEIALPTIVAAVATAHTEALIWRVSYDACMTGWADCIGQNASRLYYPITFKRW